MTTTHPGQLSHSVGLGTALPGTVSSDKGLPEADRREPLAGLAGSGSHPAGRRSGSPGTTNQPQDARFVPPLRSASPSGEDIFLDRQLVSVQAQIYTNQNLVDRGLRGRLDGLRIDHELRAQEALISQKTEIEKETA